MIIKIATKPFPLSHILESHPFIKKILCFASEQSEDSGKFVFMGEVEIEWG